VTSGELFTRLKNTPALVGVGILVFAVSFFLPAIDLGLLSVSGTSAATRSFKMLTNGVDGALPEITALSDALGSQQSTESDDSLHTWWFKTAWALNAVFLCCVGLLLTRRPPLALARILLLLSMIWALVGILDLQSSDVDFDAGAFGLGYWAWVGSFGLLLLGTLQVRVQTEASAPA